MSHTVVGAEERHRVKAKEVVAGVTTCTTRWAAEREGQPRRHVQGRNVAERRQ